VLPLLLCCCQGKREPASKFSLELRGCSIVTDEENLDCDDAGVSSLTQTSNEAPPRERAMDLKFDQSLRHEDGRCPL
jgi:hypothetical protein